MNQLKNGAIALVGVFALSCAAQDDGYDDAKTVDEVGSVEQPILVEKQFGWRSGDSNNGRCLSSGSIDCLLPRYKGMLIALGTGWTTAERSTLASLFTVNIQALRVAAPSWSNSNPIIGTTGTAACTPNSMCVQVNKVGGSTPVGPTRPIAEFLTTKCTVVSAAITESTPVNGTWKYCDEMASNIASAPLLAWGGTTFSTSNNDLRQVTGHIVALRAGLGARNHSGVETMTSLNITKNVNANNSLFGNEGCNIEHYICLQGAVGCNGLVADLGVGAACPIEAL